MRKIKDNVECRLAAAYTAGASTITVNDVSTLPDGYPYCLSAFDSGKNPLSKLKITGRSGNVLTVDGTYDGVTDVNLPNNTQLLLAVEVGVFQEISDALDDTTTTLTTQAGTIATLTGQVGTIDTTVSANSAALTTLTSRVDTQDDTISTLAGTVTTQGNALTTLTSTVTSQGSALTSLASLPGQVSTLAATVDTLADLPSQVSTLDSTVSANASTLTSLVGTVSGHTTTLTTLSSLPSQVSTLDSTVSTQASTLTSLVGTVSGHTTTLTTLSSLPSQVSTLDSTVSANASTLTSLVGTVSGHTTTLTTLSGTVSTLSTDVSAKADNSTVVLLSGDQTISGTKKFAAVEIGAGLIVRDSVNAAVSQFDGTSGYGFVVPMTFVLARGVDLVTGTNLTTIGCIAAFKGTVAKVLIQAAVNGSSGGFTLAVKKNGTSIFSTSPVVASSTTTVQSFTPTSPDFAAQDVFTVDCTAVGTGVQSVNVTLVLLTGNQ